MNGEFSFPTRVLFGPGRVRELREAVRGWGRRALLVTDPGVVASGAAQPVVDALSAGGVETSVFTGVAPNPTEADVEAGLAVYREGCDLLVAVGGGSAMDAAKAIRLLAGHPGPLGRYDDLQDGASRIGPDLPPLAAVPTTAGTGSEVGRSAVITIDGRKTVIFSPYLIPTLALCDPDLTLGMPPAVTAGTGADALTHNLEAFFSRGFHPLCDAIALDGMSRAMRWLAAAVHDGRNREARSEMMLSAMMGAIAFQKGLGASHSLAHPLSSLLGVHHGTANAIVLPGVVRFNTPAISARAGAAATALGVPASTVPEETVERIASALEGLFAAIRLPLRLSEVGAREEHLDTLAGLAFEDGCHLLNPRALDREDLKSLYRQAL